MTHPSGRRRIYLMRHGQVDYFDGGGQSILPEQRPLSEVGRAQAQAAGRAFAAAGVAFDRAISSDLPRTVQTAELVLSELGSTLRPEHWPELREIRGGRIGDLQPEEAEQEDRKSTRLNSSH